MWHKIGRGIVAWWRALGDMRGEVRLALALGAALAVLALALVSIGELGPARDPMGALATGNGSPDECDDPDDKVPPPDEIIGESFSETAATLKAPDGQVITAICIKSGKKMFGGSGHSGRITEDGLYGGPHPGSNCYDVSGLGTDTVKVVKTDNGPSCQDLSHIDIFYGDASPTPIPAPSPYPTTPTWPPAQETLQALN